MPAARLAPLPDPQQIVANGQDVVDVLMYNWATNVKDAYPPVVSSTVVALNSPNFPFTPQAVTIGPRSQIDRCFVSWNYQQRNTGATANVVRVLSVDSPLLFPQTSGTGQLLATDADPIIATAITKGLLYFTPHAHPIPITEVSDPGFGLDDGYLTTLLPEQYKKADGSLHNFILQAGDGFVQRPLLHLQFYLKAPNLGQAVKRFPYQNGFKIPMANVLNTEELIFGWPVYGRKTIALQVSGDQAAGLNFRVAALRNVQRHYRIQETTEGSLNATAANESIKFRFCDLAADYILLYATPTVVTAAPNISGTITAYD